MPERDHLEEVDFWSGAAADESARYSNIEFAGQGAYSVVVQAHDNQSGEQVAIKRIAEVFYDAHEAKKVLREIRLLRDFCHPNIVKLRGLVYPESIETFDDIFMVTEWMSGDLRRRIKSGVVMPEQTVQSYMAQLLAALAHVHGIRGIHRDLKPANILVSKDDVLKLCDFGLARREERAGTEEERECHDGMGKTAAPTPPPLKRSMTAYVVTRWYRAPEVILQEQYSSAIDIWSVGCIFKELLELMPTSKVRTSALFPGRCCIPFSFNDDDHHRTRHDQLNVIFRVLGRPTEREMSWASAESQAEVQTLCDGYSQREAEDREAYRKSLLANACGAAAAVELDLLASLLHLDPTARPSAAAALLEHPYFATLPPEGRPPLTPAADDEAVNAKFAFEQEDMSINDLRILLANDLFLMRHEETQDHASSATTPSTLGDAFGSSLAEPPSPGVGNPRSFVNGFQKGVDIEAAASRLRSLSVANTTNTRRLLSATPCNTPQGM